MRSKADLLKRAAECDGLRGREPEETRKTVFRHLRDIWLALADESETLAPEALAREIAVVEEIQAKLHRPGHLQ
jgi:hypothetical protein